MKTFPKVAQKKGVVFNDTSKGTTKSKKTINDKESGVVKHKGKPKQDHKLLLETQKTYEALGKGSIELKKVAKKVKKQKEKMGEASKKSAFIEMDLGRENRTKHNLDLGITQL